MKLILSIFFMTLSVSIYSQENSSVKKFLNDYFENFDKRILYSDNVENNYIDQLVKAISNNPIKLYKIYTSENDSPTNDKLFLTDQEKGYITKELNSQRGILWTDNLLKDSKVIARDTITTIFFKSVKGWNYFNKSYGEIYYSFTKPIMIRDNSLCFFYIAFYKEISFAGGEFSVYKIVNGKWKYFMTIWDWTS